MKNQYGVLTKSNNAFFAEEIKGLKTYSKLSAWQKRAVDRGAVRACEWHHTSAAANHTYYYDPDDFTHLNPRDFPPAKAVKEKQADLSRLKVQITFDRMVGGFTVKRKKFEEVVVEGLDIRKKDNRILGAEGRRLDSRNKAVKFLYKKPHSRSFKEISQDEARALGYRFI